MGAADSTNIAIIEENGIFIDLKEVTGAIIIDQRMIAEKSVHWP